METTSLAKIATGNGEKRQTTKTTERHNAPIMSAHAPSPEFIASRMVLSEWVNGDDDRGRRRGGVGEGGRRFRTGTREGGGRKERV